MINQEIQRTKSSSIIQMRVDILFSIFQDFQLNISKEILNQNHSIETLLNLPEISIVWEQEYGYKPNQEDADTLNGLYQFQIQQRSALKSFFG